MGILFISYGLPVSGFGKQTPSIDAEELCKPQVCRLYDSKDFNIM